MKSSQAIIYTILVGFSVVSIAFSAITYREVLTEEWEEFKQKYNKTFEDKSEDNYRFKVFLENKMKVIKHNRRQANGLHSYTLGLNKYSDLTHEEFVKLMNGYKPSLSQPKPAVEDLHPKVKYEIKRLESEPKTALPKAIDWRLYGFVTDVKDQGHCGSCWAFSSTGALEGHQSRRLGELVSLSEQNLVDCSKKYGNMGCEGGLMTNAFKYIKENNGIDTENSYPYEAHDDKCRFRNQTVGGHDKGYVEIPSGQEAKLTQALATRGPVSVAIDASQESFHLYKDGVYDEPNCGNMDENLDHGVLVVGYGEDLVHGDYYIVKNSWSKSWGEGGYVRMARNKDNQCGIATSASYPVV